MHKRCVVFTAYLQGRPQDAYAPLPGDYILCADGGYPICKALGIEPDLVIGDCDSVPQSAIPPALLKLTPPEKDDTDTMLCLRHASELGFQSCLLVGGIGGRLDHTIANIQSLAFAHASGMRATMQDGFTKVFLLEDGACALPYEEDVYISLFSYTPVCEGVCISGVQYPLDNASLTNAFPLGVSNAFAATSAQLAVKKGILLVILSKKATP